MNIERFLFNDILAQFYRNYHLTEEMKLKRQQQITNCDHLFVYTENDNQIPVIECVHCGISNRLLNFYFKFMEYLDPNLYKIADNYPEELPFEAQLFIDSFSNSFMGRTFNFDKNDFRMMSDEIIPTWHASILYQASRKIDETNDFDVTFNIMQELNSLETEFERAKISKFEDTYELVKRYFQKHEEKTKILKKK